MEWTGDTIATVTVGIAILAFLWNLHRDMGNLHRDMGNLHRDIGDLRERMARLEGLFEGIAGRHPET